MGLSLFNILPEGFFGVLAGPVKEIYGHILLRIYDMSRTYGFGIPRENLVEEIQVDKLYLCGWGPRYEHISTTVLGYQGF